METGGAEETLFVVASTDMGHVNIMLERIRNQVGALPKLKASGTLKVTVEMIPGVSPGDPRTVEQQVWGVADCVTEIIQKSIASKQPINKSNEKEKHANAH